MRPNLIFDFDGTLVDSLDALLAGYNRIAPLLRVRRLEREALPRLRTLQPREALREYGIHWWKLPLVVRAVRAELRRDAERIAPVDGIIPALHALAAGGCRCAILSTNASDNIARFLRHHRLGMFEHVDGGASMFGKARMLRRLLRRARFEPARTYYVGDEVRDIAAAQRAGIRSVAVGWGYADRTALAASHPDVLVDTPPDLVARFAGGPATVGRP